MQLHRVVPSKLVELWAGQALREETHLSEMPSRISFNHLSFGESNSLRPGGGGGGGDEVRMERAIDRLEIVFKYGCNH